MNIFIWENGEVTINSKLAFTFFSQYGFPLEMFEEMVNEKLPPKSFLRGYHIVKSYDKANNTKFAEKYLTI